MLLQLCVFQFQSLAASAFQMTHQGHACSGSFLFFFNMLFEPDLFHTVVVLDDKGTPFSLIVRVPAGQVITAQKTAIQLLCRSTLSVFAGRPSTVKAHGTLCTSKPFPAFSELFKLERLNNRADPVVSSRVHEPFKLPPCSSLSRSRTDTGRSRRRRFRIDDFHCPFRVTHDRGITLEADKNIEPFPPGCQHLNSFSPLQSASK
jgi:hypothetical protein